jgi:hypothetical protein
VDDGEVAAPGDATGCTERHELGATLSAALATLTPEQREVVLLKDLEGWDHRAIARAGDLGGHAEAAPVQRASRLARPAGTGRAGGAPA